MVTPSRSCASFYCYVRCLKLFVIVSNNALYIQMQEIVVPLFYDVISKYKIIASTHMVVIRFLILYDECNIALQMSSTEKLETRAVIKFCQQQGGTPSKTLNERAARPQCIFRLGHMFYRRNHQHQRQGRGREKRESYTGVSGECVKKRQAYTLGSKSFFTLLKFSIFSTQKI